MADRRRPDAAHLMVRDLLLGPYVLGELGTDEEREVERHLQLCPECREEERRLRETHERLAGAAIANAAAPPHLKERALAASSPGDEAGTVGARRTPRPAILRVAVAVTLLLVLAPAVYYLATGVYGPPEEIAPLSPTALAPGGGGELETEVSDAGTEANLTVWGLPETGPNEYYELWFGREEGRVSAGTFTVGGDGRGRLRATCPEVAGGYRRVGVTLERFPEEPRREDARVVLGGELRGT